MELDVVIEGDCLDIMKGWPDSCVDMVITDPPYGLEFMGKDWDRLDAGLPQENVWKGRHGKGGGKVGDDPRRPGSRHRVSHGAKPSRFRRCTKCGKRQFSGSPCTCESPDWIYETPKGPPSSVVRMQRWHQAWAEAALRVLKPGGHLLAFGGTRTHHRLICALEDAGFEIRDCLMWLYGAGFPKSLDVSKAIDKATGAKLEAEQWQGWGTGLKPAWEPIALARKPLAEQNIAANVLKWGTGALNVDASRIATGDKLGGGMLKGTNPRSEGWDRPGRHDPDTIKRRAAETADKVAHAEAKGRWPANVILDEDAGAMLDEQTGERGNKWKRNYGEEDYKGRQYDGGSFGGGGYLGGSTYADAGGASRFFYCPKASPAERGERNTHPTVKPLALMAYLCRLATPPGGIVLDPFAGSGSTCLAARGGGFRFVGIEKDHDYCELARQRLRDDAPLFSQSTEQTREGSAP